MGLVLSAAARADIPRARAAVSSRELDNATALFERFHPALLASNQPAYISGRTLSPAFSPFTFAGVPGFRYLATHLIGTLVSGELNELDMYLATVTATTTFEVPHHASLSGSNAYKIERLVNSVAFIEGGVEPDMDVLVRPVPFGFSVYVQFRSSSAPEQFKIEDKVECSPQGSELIRRLQAGMFSVEELPGETEDECEPYSRARVSPTSEIQPQNTAANYAQERHLIGIAQRRAQHDRASVLTVVSASAARDRTGRIVPTEMAWRREEEPVLRVHLHDGHYHYPVLARIDFLTADR
jgi:hypothetical protein